MAEYLTVDLVIEITVSKTVRSVVIDKGEYDEWRGDTEDTPQQRKEFIESERHFDPSYYFDVPFGWELEEARIDRAEADL